MSRRNRSVSSGRRSAYSTMEGNFRDLASVGSEGRLSNREMDSLKRLATERDREERRSNIVVKGITQEAPTDEVEKYGCKNYCRIK